MKDLYGMFGYLGSCEPDGHGGFKGRLIGIEESVTYKGATLEILEKVHRRAIDDYLIACRAAGRRPELAPEPFGIVGSRDVRLEFDIRRDPVLIHILGYYSLFETFLRSRDHSGTARTFAGWCSLKRQDRSTDIETAMEVTKALDRYGWYPCPTWSRS
jgi:hypothetical protein